MNAAVHGLDLILAVLRPAFFFAALAMAVVSAVDWAVRTRRINPFSGVARFFRATVDPLIAPVERRIVRAGGVPSNAPWYALAGVVLAGIIVITALGFLQEQLTRMAAASGMGSAGLLRLFIAWAFGIVKIALLVYVVSGWIRVSPYSPWVRWAHVISEPILRPLRQVIPPIGGAIDITPIVAYLLLTLIEQFVMGAV